MATPAGSDAADKQPIEDPHPKDPPPDDPPPGDPPTDSGGATTTTAPPEPALPTREELAGALGVSANDPAVDEQLGSLRVQSMMEAAARRQQQQAAAEQAAAAEAARQAAAEAARQKQYTVDYDDPFTGERVVEVKDRPPEFSTPEAASEVKLMQDAQDLLRQGITKEKLETEGSSNTTTVQLGDSTATSTLTVRPDGRLERTITVVDADGDGRRTTDIRESLTGSGLSVVNEVLDDGKVVGREVLAQVPGLDGTVPTAGPVATKPPTMPTISQDDADSFVDAIRTGGPSTLAGQSLLDQVEGDLGLDIGGPTSATPSTSSVPGFTTGGTGGSSSTTATSPDAGGGRSTMGPSPDVREPFAHFGAGSDPTGTSTGPATNSGADLGVGGNAADGSASTPGWQGALDDLGAGGESEPDYVGASGSRGSSPGGTDGLSIGSLGTSSDGVSVTADVPATPTSPVLDFENDGEGGQTGTSITVTKGGGAFATIHTSAGDIGVTGRGMEQLAEEREQEEANAAANDTETSTDTSGSDTSGSDTSGSDDTGTDDTGSDDTGYMDPDADMSGGWVLTDADVVQVMGVRGSDGVHGGDTAPPDLAGGVFIQGPSTTVSPGGEDPNPDVDDSSSIFVVPAVMPGDEISMPVNPDLGPAGIAFDPHVLDDPTAPIAHDAFATADMNLGDDGLAFQNNDLASFDGSFDRGMLDSGGAMMAGADEEAGLDAFGDGPP